MPSAPISPGEAPPDADERDPRNPMLVAFFVLLMAGIPVALTLAISGLVFGYIGFGPLLFNLLPNRIFGVVTNYTLIAMPLFVFMGVMLEIADGRRSDGSDRASAGGLRGGLGIGIILVGVLMGATTGIVGATVVTLGLLTLRPCSGAATTKASPAASICASGTLGQIIPPSLILILLADILNELVGTLFAAAMIPGPGARRDLLRLLSLASASSRRRGAGRAGGGTRIGFAPPSSAASCCAWCCRRSGWSAPCLARSSAAWPRRPRPPRWAHWGRSR